MTTRLHPRDQLRISASDPHSILKDFNGEMSPRRFFGKPLRHSFVAAAALIPTSDASGIISGT